MAQAYFTAILSDLQFAQETLDKVQQHSGRWGGVSDLALLCLCKDSGLMPCLIPPPNWAVSLQSTVSIPVRCYFWVIFLAFVGQN